MLCYCGGDIDDCEFGDEGAPNCDHYRTCSVIESDEGDEDGYLGLTGDE